jgi:hypothetical protein
MNPSRTPYLHQRQVRSRPKLSRLHLTVINGFLQCVLAEGRVEEEDAPVVHHRGGTVAFIQPHYVICCLVADIATVPNKALKVFLLKVFRFPVQVIRFQVLQVFRFSGYTYSIDHVIYMYFKRRIYIQFIFERPSSFYILYCRHATNYSAHNVCPRPLSTACKACHGLEGGKSIC